MRVNKKLTHISKKRESFRDILLSTEEEQRGMVQKKGSYTDVNSFVYKVTFLPLSVFI